MKRFLTFTALLIFASIAARSQVFTIGPKIGLSNTTLSINDNIEEYESGDARYSYHAGVFARVKIAGFYLQPEAYFNSVKGEYVDPNRNADDQKVEFNQNKIDVPVLFGYKIGPVRVNAGPVASFNLNQLEDFDDQDLDDYKTAVFAYQAGLGVDIAKLIIDLKYEGNISKQVVLGDEGDVRVNQIMLSVGYKIL